MDRRRFLAGSGAVCSGLLAGCFGDDEKPESGDEKPESGDEPTEFEPEDPTGPATPSTETPGAAQADAAGWTQERQDSRLTGTNRATTGVRSQFGPAWETDLSPGSGEFVSEHVSPVRVTAGGDVYYAAVTRSDGSGRGIALTRVAGGEGTDDVMYADIGSVLPGTEVSVVDMAVAGNRAVCSFRRDALSVDGGISGELVVFDLSSGETVYDEDWPGGGPITVAEDAFYLGTVRMEPRSPEVTTGVAAYGITPNAVRWHTTVAGYGYFAEPRSSDATRPAVHSGTVYLSGADGLVGVDTASGNPSPFSEHDGFRIVDSQRGVLYVVGENGIRGIDLLLGRETGERFSVDGTPRGAALSGETLVVTTEENITALDVSTGQTQWSESAPAGVASLPSVAGDTLYYIGDSRVVARDLSSGERLDASPLRAADERDADSLSPQPIVAAGLIVVRAGNHLYAFESGE